MTSNARIYITAFLALGLAVLGVAFSDWRPVEPEKFASYFIIAILASVLKVSMPAMAGNMSFNFLFVLIGVVDLTLPGTLLLGCSAVLIESIWRPRIRSSTLQVFFAIANMAIAVYCTYHVFRSGYLMAQGVGLPIR